MTRRFAAVLAALVLASSALAGPLDEMSVERWAKLREAERYQLNIAEKFYREQQYKVAADEYEKFLKLYETSEGAPYAQLKWSHCQVKLRKQNTAIKDGYQTLLDYYPESPEAPVAALLIGRTHKDTGDLKAAKKALVKAASTYPKHFAAVLSLGDLVEIATKENDAATRLTLLRQLTYDVDRKGPAADACVSAARELARASFRGGDFPEGLKALATTCKDTDLPAHLTHHDLGRLLHTAHDLTGAMDEPTKKLGEKLADAADGWFRGQAAEAGKDEKRRAYAVACWSAAADVRGYARQPEKQREVLEAMIAAVGADDGTLGKLAAFYKANKQGDRAREVYAKFKDAAAGQGEIAQSFAEEKQYDKAVEVYRKLAVQDEKAAAKWLAAAAMAYRHGGKVDQAVAVYRELLTADAANAAEWHFQTAEAYYYGHRWKDAIAAYRGTDRFPHNTFHIAEAHRQLKQWDEAIGLYSQILATHPPSAATALFRIAQTHEQAGRTEPAIKVFKQVCDRFPKTQEGSQAHAHLNEKYKITVTLGGAKD